MKIRYISPLILSLAMFFGFASTASAQASSPAVGRDASTDTGLRPYMPYAGVQENINLTNGNLNLKVPLLKLPGRNGHDFVLELQYDSKIFKLDIGYDAETNSVGGTWMREQRLPGVGSWGWRFNIPTINSTSTTDFSTGACVGATTVTLSDGGRYIFNNNPGCGALQILIMDSEDTTGMQLDISNPYDVVAILRDGTRIHFPGLSNAVASKVVDSDGNVITYQISAPAGITTGGTITDTLGRQISIITSDPNSLYTISYKDSSGTPQTISIVMGSGNLSYSFIYPVPSQVSDPRVIINGRSRTGSSTGFVTQVVLPNNRQFSFQYNGYVELTKITYPTGGYTAYDYSLSGYSCPVHLHYDGIATLGADFRQVRQKRVCSSPSGSCASEDLTTYTPTLVSGASPNNQSMDVVTYDGTGKSYRTSHQFTQGVAPGESSEAAHGLSPHEVSVAYYSDQGALLRTVTTTYDGDFAWSLPTVITTTLENGLVKKAEFSYDTYSVKYLPYPDPVHPQPILQTVTRSLDNVTQHREYAYGASQPGPLMRRTDNTWIHVNPVNNQDYFSSTIRILSLKASEAVYDGGGNLKAQTQFEYDSYAEGIATSGAVQHESSFGTNYTTRGNLTASKRWRNTDGAWLESRNRLFDDAGNILKTRDPGGHDTQFNYADVWGNATCQPTGGNTRAYLTSVTNALGHVTQSTYNSCSGTVATTTDPNNQTTSFSYDMLDRLILTNFPGGGQVMQTYNETSTPLNFTTSTKITAAMNLDSTVKVDGIGRVMLSSLDSDPQGATLTKPEYDALGRKKRVYNPTRCNPPETNCGESTWGYTEFEYDALSRTTKVIPPDGTTSVNNITTSYSGNTVTVTDQAGKQRRSYTDALGRLIQVDEPGPGGGGGGTPGTGSVSITGLEQSAWVNDPTWGCVLWDESGGCIQEGWIDNWHWVYDSGVVVIIVNGVAKDTAYGEASTASSVADALAAAINADANYPVTASAAGSLVNLTSKTTGSASNYSLSASSYTTDPNFSQPSFVPVPSGSTLTGGSNGTGSGSLSLSTPTITAYTYDALGNLTNVVQGGSRQRTFTYNSLSQLTQASNPESGTINYAYDADGNVITKTAPKPNQTGSLTVATTYSYDALHRLTQKSYSDGTTPTAIYGYDAVTPTGCTPPSLTITNGVGKRTAMCDGAGAEAWSYAITTGVGWKTTDRRTTNSVTKDFVYQNNFDGSLATLAYPSNRTLTYTPNAAGRTVSAVDSTGPINYATNASYTAGGALSSLTNGASIVSTSYYNNRLQPCRISVKSTGTAPTNCGDTTNVGNVLDFSYGFAAGIANNGNVMTVANNRNTARTQSFTYDELNRVSTAQTQATTQPHCWGETFAYDIWSNLLTIGGIQPQYNGCTQESLTVLATTKNQISNSCYDSAGNLVLNSACPDPPGTPFTPTYNYNAENHMTSTGGVTYTYDGNGKRVMKSNGKLYWYGTGSDALQETDLSGTPSADYIFFNGKRTARLDLPSATVHYYFSNHLGSASVVTSSAGVIQDESDYYPFGGERVVTDTDPNQYKFTGKERDTESGLDFFIARYSSSGYGRFNSSDPENASAFENIDDPQSWNGYAYARNNPLIYADLDGMNYRICDAEGKNCADLTDEQYEQYRKENPDIYSTPSGDLYVRNDNGTDTKIGTEAYYDEKKGEALQEAGFLAESGIKGSARIMMENAVWSGAGAGLGLMAKLLPRATQLQIGFKVVINWAHKITEFRPGHVPPPGSVAEVTEAVTQSVQAGRYTVLGNGRIEGTILVNGVECGFSGRFVDSVVRISTVFMKVK